MFLQNIIKYWHLREKMENSELYKGLTAVVIGGTGKADYKKRLLELGFEEVYRVHDRKSRKRMKGLISQSNIAILFLGRSSHTQGNKTVKTICEKVNTLYVPIAGSPGPERLKNHLIDDYPRIKSKLKKMPPRE